eukprot:g17323.t1
MAHLIALELERLASVDVEHVHKSEMTDFLGISEEDFLYVFPPRWQNQVEFYNIHTLAERCVEECPQEAATALSSFQKFEQTLRETPVTHPAHLLVLRVLDMRIRRALGLQGLSSVRREEPLTPPDDREEVLIAGGGSADDGTPLEDDEQVGVPAREPVPSPVIVQHSAALAEQRSQMERVESTATRDQDISAKTTLVAEPADVLGRSRSVTVAQPPKTATRPVMAEVLDSGSGRPSNGKKLVQKDDDEASIGSSRKGASIPYSSLPVTRVTGFSQQNLPTTARSAFEKAKEKLAQVQSYQFAPRARSVGRMSHLRRDKRADSPTLGSIVAKNRELIGATSPFSRFPTEKTKQGVRVGSASWERQIGGMLGASDDVNEPSAGRSSVQPPPPARARSTVAPAGNTTGPPPAYLPCFLPAGEPMAKMQMHSNSNSVIAAAPRTRTPTLGLRAALAERAFLLRKLQQSGPQPLKFDMPTVTPPGQRARTPINFRAPPVMMTIDPPVPVRVPEPKYLVPARLPLGVHQGGVTGSAGSAAASGSAAAPVGTVVDTGADDACYSTSSAVRPRVINATTMISTSQFGRANLKLGSPPPRVGGANNFHWPGKRDAAGGTKETQASSSSSKEAVSGGGGLVALPQYQ